MTDDRTPRPRATGEEIDLAKEAGTGVSGPDDVGTRPQDVVGNPTGGIGIPGSPTERLWEREEEDTDGRHSTRRERPADAEKSYEPGAQR